MTPEPRATRTQALAEHAGGCHCGDVRFVVHAPRSVTVERCNCSICAKSNYLHLIVPAAHFRLGSDPGALVEYAFNTGTARHRFCGRCGVKSFYVPRSNPNGYSVNLRCLDRAGFDRVTIRPFDGQNFEDNVNALAHLA